MKILCTIALLAMGIALPGCVRSVGVYDDGPRHMYHDRYHGSGYGAHYRPQHRPYSPYSQSFGQPRYEQPHRHYHRDDGVNLRFHVRD